MISLGTYASVGHREWESDADVIKSNVDPKDCPDIAQQLINGETGKNFNVIMGGGRKKLLPNSVTDEEGKRGQRVDGQNLIQKWKTDKKNQNARYIWNKSQLLTLPKNTDYVLGLFEDDHLEYNLEANPDTEPSMTEMVEAAIKVLNKGTNGYFLFVEGGKIDIAHHEAFAKKALDETIEFSKAIQRAADITDRMDTLIIVTSDHAHTMSLAGYPDRGNDILGSAGTADDELPYSTLTYANGPGYTPEDADGNRHNLDKDKKRKNF